jgi:hypothetical protein
VHCEGEAMQCDARHIIALQSKGIAWRCKAKQKAKRSTAKRGNGSAPRGATWQRKGTAGQGLARPGKGKAIAVQSYATPSVATQRKGTAGLRRARPGKGKAAPCTAKQRSAGAWHCIAAPSEATHGEAKATQSKAARRRPGRSLGHLSQVNDKLC